MNELTNNYQDQKNDQIDNSNNKISDCETSSAYENKTFNIQKNNEAFNSRNTRKNLINSNSCSSNTYKNNLVFSLDKTKDSENHSNKSLMILPQLNPINNSNFEAKDTKIKSLYKLSKNYNNKEDSSNNLKSNLLTSNNKETSHMNDKANKKYLNSIYSNFTSFSQVFLGNNKKYDDLIQKYLIQEDYKKKGINNLVSTYNNRNKLTKSNDIFLDSKIENLKLKNSAINKDNNHNIINKSLSSADEGDSVSKDQNDAGCKKDVCLSSFDNFRSKNSKGLIFSIQSSYKKLSLLNSSKNLKDKSKNASYDLLHKPPISIGINFGYDNQSATNNVNFLQFKGAVNFTNKKNPFNKNKNNKTTNSIF